MFQYDQKWLNQLDEIIEENINDPDFQLSDLSQAIMTSPAQLNRRINKLTGLSPRMYIRAKKLEKAKEFLELGSYPTVAEVAAAVGYRHVSHFSNIFQQEYGRRPISYLKV